MRTKKIAIVGMGYVGLTTAICFASKGFNVIAYDVDNKKVDSVKNGNITFYEKGLQPLLRKALREKRLRITSDPSLLEHSVYFFVCVGTPNTPDGDANLTFVENACTLLASIIKKATNYKIICIKSTVPPGTAVNTIFPLIEKVSRKKEGHDFGVCSNPEFLREGSAVIDTLKPDKVVIGSESPRTLRMMKELYDDFYDMQPPVINTSNSNAEMIKYANNAFLATKISFINAIARICQILPGCDVKVVANAIGLDKRIGNLFLNAGLGYGGSCFPKDVRALVSLSEKRGVDASLLGIVQKINEDQPLEAVRMAEKVLGVLEGKIIAILGLSFKPDTDDMRESVSIKIIEKLLSMGASVKVHDPMALPKAKELFGNHIEYCGNKNQCIQGSDCVILVTEWKEYSTLKPSTFMRLMHKPVIIDGRRILSPSLFVGRLDYHAIGLNR